MNRKCIAAENVSRQNPFSICMLFAALLFVFAMAQTVSAAGLQRQMPKVPDAEQIIANLTAELSLSGDQVAQIRPIIEDHTKKRDAVIEKYADQDRSGRQNMRAELDALRTEQDARLQEVLTEEQMVKYRAYTEKKRQEMQNRMDGSGGGKGKGGRSF
ncbi:MAG: hypothetical protein AB7S75_01465 [Desulfococcaceae bacterium]